MNKRRMMKKVFAILLAFVLIITGVNIPKLTPMAAEAAEIDLKEYITMSGTTSGTSSDGSAQTERILISLPDNMDEKAEWEALGIKSLVVEFSISNFTTTNQYPGAMLFFMAQGSDEWNQGTWADLNSSGTLTSTMNMDDLDWGNGTKVGQLGLEICNITAGSKVEYAISSIKFITGDTSSGETGTVDTDRTNDSGVTATVTAQGTPSNDWSGFDMTLSNNTGTSICDWVVVMQVPSGYASAFKCWNATFVADGDTIYLYPMQSGANAVMTSNSLSANTPGFGFGGKYVSASDITVTKVLYNYGSTSTKDYSDGETNDESSGGGSGSGITIPSGDLKDYNYSDIDYNYAKLLQYSLYFYDANMCGDEVTEKSLHSWRNDCHTYDKYTYTRTDGTTVTVDLTGGFHDAGDHVKFGLPEAYAAFTLGMSYDTNKAAYVAAKQEEHLETITTHFADYLVDCTVLNSAGTAVEAFCVQVGNGGAGYDHGYWGAPEEQPQNNRTATFSTTTEPHTDIVSLSAAALAMQYKNFGGEEYLQTAKLLFDYAKKSVDNGTASVGTTSTTYYQSSAWEDDYCLAAKLLYDITKDEDTYLNAYNSKKDQENAMKPYWPLSWDNVGPAVAYYAGDSSKLSTLMGQASGKDTYGGYVCMDKWGSARYNTSLQYTSLLYDQLTSTDTYRSWAEGQMKYLLGNNEAKQCFVVGYNDFSSKYPHHRAASGYTGGDKGTTAQKYVLLGALVGGQLNDGTYEDSASNYVCNEVAIDYNATLVAAAAAIYEDYTADTTNQYVDTNYHIDSGSTGGGESQTVAVTGVSLDKTELNIDIGEVAQLTAKIAPENATDKTYAYSIGSTAVATVDSTGKVTGVSPGQTTLTVKTTDGGKTAHCSVRVYGVHNTPAAPTVASTTEYSVTLNVVNGCKYSMDGINWQESPTFNSLTPNTEYTFYQMMVASGYYRDSVVSAGTKVKTLPIYATAVSLDKDSLAFEIGGVSELTTAKLTATVSPDSATTKAVTWDSSDKSVVTVDASGNVKAVGPGTATITVKATGGKDSQPSDTCMVTVWKTPEVPIQAPSTSATPTKDTVTLTPYEGCEYRIAPDGQWQDSNVFTGLEPNTEYTFEIRVKADPENNIREGETVKITVKTAQEGVTVVEVTGVAFDNKLSESCSITIGDSDSWSFTATVTPENATDKTITYTSSNPDVAKIDENGVVTAISPGYTEIKATTKTGGYEDRIKLSVYKKYDMPSAPTLASKTTTTVTLSKVDGCQYSKDGVNWQSSNVFTGLTANTSYTFYVKKVANGYWLESDRSAGLTVATDKESTGNAGGDTGNTGGSTGGTTGGNAGGSGGTGTSEPFVAPDIKVSYRTHIQTFGWEGDEDDIKTWKSNGTMSGTSGLAKRLEGINIVVEPTTDSEDLDLGIQYTTHCQSYGWLPWSADGDMNGTEGEAKRLEAIMIQLTGEHAQAYDVYYRVHAQSYGWLGWAKNGEPAGTAGYAKRLEGIQVVVVKKDESFNQKMEGITSARTEAFVAKSGSSPIVNYPATSNTNPVVPGEDIVNVAYRTHVQSFGWQGWKYNGQMSGTSGLAKRLEGIEINITNKDYDGGVAYATHVQTYGWQGADLEDPTTWRQDGEMAGTSGEAKRLEAICITLTGEMAEHYDIYYRVHAQSYGWLGWAKNGDPAGTAGYAKRLEGIQIVVVPKGSAAPANTYMGVTSVKTQAYVEK